MNIKTRVALPFLLLSLLVTTGVYAADQQSGKAAPPFSLPSLTDAAATNITLSDYHGRVLYVDFWASWCGPCRKSLPQLNKLRAELEPQGFEVIAINVDEFKEDALEFLSRYPVDYPLARDGDGVVAKLYKVRGMPSSYLVNRAGELVYVHEGFREGDIEEIKTRVTALLQEAAP